MRLSSSIASSIRGGSNPESISRTLQPGTYFVRVNQYSGDTTYRLTLSATPNQPAVPDYAGNSLGSARNLGVLSGERSFADFVGNSDRDDYYRFQLAGRSTFELDLNGLRADADVQLLDSSGRTIASSMRGGNQSESIRRTLDAGTYFVRVYRYSGDTNYLLTMRAQAEGPADNAGNSRDQARNLGTLSGSVTLNDFVGQADRADFYRFHVNSASNFRLRMDGMSADADVQLLDANGRHIAGSFRGGMNPEAVDRVIESGDYFVQVYPYANANTNYRLSLETAAVQQGLDVSRVSPIADYDGHLGADYMAAAGTAVLSPVSGRVVAVGPVDDYGTMAVAVEVTLPSYRWLPTEQGGWAWTNRTIVTFGHLRPSRELVASGDANYRFNQGRGELGYSVGSTITVGQRLGYVETHGYEGSSTGSHVHVTMLDAANAPSGLSYWPAEPERPEPRVLHPTGSGLVAARLMARARKRNGREGASAPSRPIFVLGNRVPDCPDTPKLLTLSWCRRGVAGRNQDWLTIKSRESRSTNETAKACGLSSTPLSPFARGSRSNVQLPRLGRKWLRHSFAQAVRSDSVAPKTVWLLVRGRHR